MQPITRRAVLTAAGCAAVARQAVSQGGKYPRDLTKEDVDRWMTELSNWGKWGADDQAGTVNLITPATRKAAVAQVREGVSVSMALDADLPKEGSTGGPLPGMGGGAPRGGGNPPSAAGGPPAAGSAPAGAGAPPAGRGQGGGMPNRTTWTLT